MDKSTLTENSEFYKSFSTWIDGFLKDQKINTIEPKVKSIPIPPPLPLNLYTINDKLLQEAENMNESLNKNVIDAQKKVVLLKSKKLVVPDELKLKLEALFSNRVENTNFVESDIFENHNKLENKKNKQNFKKKTFFNKFICLNN